MVVDAGDSEMSAVQYEMRAFRAYKVPGPGHRFN